MIESDMKFQWLKSKCLSLFLPVILVQPVSCERIVGLGAASFGFAQTKVCRLPGLPEDQNKTSKT